MIEKKSQQRGINLVATSVTKSTKMEENDIDEEEDKQEVYLNIRRNFAKLLSLTKIFLLGTAEIHKRVTCFYNLLYFFPPNLFFPPSDNIIS
jgi:hypothetical protein